MGLTLRYSTGLVTLNLSMVVMMMAGVVRKKSRMKRTTLITRQRSHQMKPRMERCSLGRRGGGGVILRTLDRLVSGNIHPPPILFLLETDTQSVRSPIPRAMAHQ